MRRSSGVFSVMVLFVSLVLSGGVEAQEPPPPGGGDGQLSADGDGGAALVITHGDDVLVADDDGASTIFLRDTESGDDWSLRGGVGNATAFRIDDPDGTGRTIHEAGATGDSYFTARQDLKISALGETGCCIFGAMQLNAAERIDIVSRGAQSGRPALYLHAAPEPGGARGEIGVFARAGDEGGQISIVADDGDTTGGSIFLNAYDGATSNGQVRITANDTTIRSFENSSPVDEVLRLESQVPPQQIFENATSEAQWFFAMTADDQFKISRNGTGKVEAKFFENGNLQIAGTLIQGSDVNAKTDLVPADTTGVLDALAGLDILTWEYIDDPGVTHLGPTAQDFAMAFGLGDTTTGIAAIDADGVALAAIQALAEQNQAQAAQIALLSDRIEELEGND